MGYRFAPACPRCLTPVEPPELGLTKSWTCPKCNLFYPPRSEWLGYPTPECGLCGKRTENLTSGMCHRCHQRFQKESRLRRVAAEKAQREAEKAARKAMREKPPELPPADPGQQTLWNPIDSEVRELTRRARTGDPDAIDKLERLVLRTLNEPGATPSLTDEVIVLHKAHVTPRSRAVRSYGVRGAFANLDLANLSIQQEALGRGLGTGRGVNSVASWNARFTDEPYYAERFPVWRRFEPGMGWYQNPDTELREAARAFQFTGSRDDARRYAAILARAGLKYADAPVPGRKLPVDRIWLYRAEGPVSEARPDVSTNSTDPWGEAQAELRRWGRTAPGRDETSGGRWGGYDKCDFKVWWLDGEDCSGRYDLVRGGLDDARQTLSQHVAGFAMSLAGQRRPAWTATQGGEAHWRDMLRRHEADGSAAAARKLLAFYDLEGRADAPERRVNPVVATYPVARSEPTQATGHCMHRPRPPMPTWVSAMCCRCYPKHVTHGRDLYVGKEPSREPCAPVEPCDCDLCLGNQCPSCGFFYKFCRCGGRDPFAPRRVNPGLG